MADKIAFLGSIEKELEDAVKGLSQIWKWKINKSKTKVLFCIKKKQTRHECIKISEENLEEVKEFCYLGSKISCVGRSQREIKSRISKAKIKFNLKQI